MLLAQVIPSALAFDLPSVGNRSAARIAMMAITTSNSIRVKPPRETGCANPDT